MLQTINLLLLSRPLRAAFALSGLLMLGAPTTCAALDAADLLAQNTSAAVKRVAGDGKRVLYIFEDPLCAICRRLDAELQQVKNVTVYSFLIPVTSPQAGEAAIDLYCTQAPGLALSELYILGKYPETTRRSAECKGRAATSIALAKQLGVQSTPTLVFPGGARFGYLVNAAQIEKALR